MEHPTRRSQVHHIVKHYKRNATFLADEWRRCEAASTDGFERHVGRGVLTEVQRSPHPGNLVSRTLQLNFRSTLYSTAGPACIQKTRLSVTLGDFHPMASWIHRTRMNPDRTPMGHSDSGTVCYATGPLAIRFRPTAVIMLSHASAGARYCAVPSATNSAVQGRRVAAHRYGDEMSKLHSVLPLFNRKTAIGVMQPCRSCRMGEKSVYFSVYGRDGGRGWRPAQAGM